MDMYCVIAICDYSDGMAERRKLHDQFLLRLPDGLREQLASAAEAAGRSTNAEIVARLQAPAASPDIALMVARYEKDLAKAQFEKHRLYTMVLTLADMNRSLSRMAGKGLPLDEDRWRRVQFLEGLRNKIVHNAERLSTISEDEVRRALEVATEEYELARAALMPELEDDIPTFPAFNDEDWATPAATSLDSTATREIPRRARLAKKASAK